MGDSFNTAFSLTAAIVNHSKRKKAFKRISKVNEANKNIQKMGYTALDQIIPCNCQMGNICISGGSIDLRNELIIQNCKQSISIGIPTVIIHEGNYHLEQLLRNTFSSHRYFRLINAANPYYDPIFRLSDMEVGHFVMNAALKEYRINPDGALYVKALATILHQKGINPYMRMLANCPHNAINNIILELEKTGKITGNEADSIRNDIVAGKGSRADVEYFLRQIELESTILSGKQNLSRCTSVTECVRNSGILSMDVASCAKKNQLAMISTEIDNCAKLGIPFRIIVDATTISNDDKIVEVLKKSSNSVAWTISCPDINRMIGNDQSELATWLALSHRAILFAHSIKTCELLSAELGEYDHIDIVESYATSNNIGKIGYHFGTNSSFNTSSKRERVVKPEVIENLRDREFILLDNYTSLISRGIIS